MGVLMIVQSVDGAIAVSQGLGHLLLKTEGLFNVVPNMSGLQVSQAIMVGFRSVYSRQH